MSTEPRLEEITAAAIMRSDLMTIPSAMPLSEVERVLTENGISGAPVVDHAGRIAGVISLRDIVERHTDNPDGRRAPETWSWGIEEAAADAPIEPDMARGRGSAADDIDPALDDDDDVGSPEDLEERELERMVTGENAPVESPDTAADLMTAQVHAVAADATLPEVAAAMVDHAIHRVLVRTDGRFVGMVTATDVLRAIAGLGRKGKAPREGREGRRGPGERGARE